MEPFKRLNQREYGHAIRMRRRLHYTRGEDFCTDFSMLTGLALNKETLYRIERGIQPPTVDQMIAFKWFFKYLKSDRVICGYGKDMTEIKTFAIPVGGDGSEVFDD